MSDAPIRRWDAETLLVAALAVCVSCAAFLVCIHRGYILLFGDAVAHINIARRVFDSRSPGPLQLGTVWLPLPHLLIMPFVVSLSAWHSGIAASIPSLISHILGTVGVFRLVRGALSFPSQSEPGARFAAWFAAAIYGLNPNLLYLQSTAMTEPVYLALFIWSIVFFSEFVQAGRGGMGIEASRALAKCSVCVAGAELTRYDGWFLAGVLGVAAIIVVKTGFGRGGTEVAPGQVPVRKFLLIVAIAPILWFAYNGLIYRNPLEFANGPYSARAIEQRTSVPGYPPHPGANSLAVAGRYFVKSAELNLAEGHLQKVWVAIAFLGSLLALSISLRLAPLLLLWVPLPFYMLSIAYGSVPIFIPTWWPFSYYNVRYGTQLIPAAAVFVGVAVYCVANFVRPRAGKVLIGGAAAMIAGVSYYTIWKAGPVCFREAWINSRARIALETALAAQLRTLPLNSTILMYLGEHGGALQDASIPLRRTINEGDHRTWKRPVDPGGLWERALADPSRYADYAVGIGTDPVAIAMQNQNPEVIAVIDVTGQPRAKIYRATKH